MKRAQRTSRRPSKKKIPTIPMLFPAYRKGAYLESSAAKRDDALRQLSVAYRTSGLVLYIGAGLSMSIGLPSWSNLVQALTVRLMTMRMQTAADAIKGLTDESRWELQSSFLQKLEVSPSLERPVLMLARSLKDELKDKLGAEIGRVLYRRIRNFPDSAIYHRLRANRFPIKGLSRGASLTLLDAIAKLSRFERDAKGVQAIINYNYDDLLEEYLQSQNIKCKAVLSGRDRIPNGTLPSYHVHGLIRYKSFVAQLDTSLAKRAKSRAPSTEGNFVFSEDEYHAEYADAYKWSNLTQMSHLGSHTGLLIGLSLEDPNIRRLIDVTHRQYPDTRNYAVLTRKKSLKGVGDNEGTVLTNLFEEVESHSFEGMGVTPIWVDKYSEIPGVLNRIVDGESHS